MREQDTGKNCHEKSRCGRPSLPLRLSRVRLNSAGIRWNIEECFGDAKGAGPAPGRQEWGWAGRKCGDGRAGTGESTCPSLPVPACRWSGSWPTSSREVQRGRSRMERNPDPEEGSRSAPTALPADLATHAFTEKSAGLVLSEETASSRGPPLPLSAPTQTFQPLFTTSVLENIALSALGKLVIASRQAFCSKHAALL